MRNNKGYNSSRLGYELTPEERSREARQSWQTLFNLQRLQSKVYKQSESQPGPDSFPRRAGTKSQLEHPVSGHRYRDIQTFCDVANGVVEEQRQRREREYFDRMRAEIENENKISYQEPIDEKLFPKRKANRVSYGARNLGSRLALKSRRRLYEDYIDDMERKSKKRQLMKNANQRYRAYRSQMESERQNMLPVDNRQLFPQQRPLHARRAMSEPSIYSSGLSFGANFLSDQQSISPDVPQYQPVVQQSGLRRADSLPDMDDLRDEKELQDIYSRGKFIGVLRDRRVYQTSEYNTRAQAEQRVKQYKNESVVRVRQSTPRNVRRRFVTQQAILRPTVEKIPMNLYPIRENRKENWFRRRCAIQ